MNIAGSTRTDGPANSWAVWYIHISNVYTYLDLGPHMNVERARFTAGRPLQNVQRDILLANKIN